MQPKAERKAIFAAMAAAYHGKSGSLQLAGVQWLERRVEELLPEGGKVRDYVDEFCAAYAHVRRDQEAVAVLSDRLLENVRILLLPEPVDAGRKDIHG